MTKSKLTSKGIIVCAAGGAFFVRCRTPAAFGQAACGPPGERRRLMEENRSTFRLSGREKAGLIWHYLRPCWGHFAAALLCACLSMALNALTPQIIRITVDSILGSEEAKLPALLLRVLPLETLRQEPVTALWWAAGPAVPRVRGLRQGAAG